MLYSTFTIYQNIFLRLQIKDKRDACCAIDIFVVLFSCDQSQFLELHSHLKHWALAKAESRALKIHWTLGLPRTVSKDK